MCCVEIFKEYFWKGGMTEVYCKVLLLCLFILT